MNRWLLIGSLAGLMFAFTGCATCSQSGGCSSSSCSSSGGIFGGSSCGPGCQGGGQSGCRSGAGQNVMMGLASRGAGLMGMCGGKCGGSCGRPGCMAGKLGWQSGGLDYSSHLQTGLMGHNAAQNLNGRGFTPGPPTGQVAYPYYSVRGPRDFLVDNPPTIGR